MKSIIVFIYCYCFHFPAVAHRMPLARMMAAYVQDVYATFRQPKFERGGCEMLAFRVCGARQNFYVFSLYSYPEIDDRVYECLLR